VAKRRASGPGSVSLGETASASCFDWMTCRGPGDGALALLPEASATPVGPDDSWGERGTLTRRAVGRRPAALVLWEASPPRRRNASRSSPLLWGEGIAGRAKLCIKIGAADTSTSSAVSRVCSPTSWARNSYETLLRSRGSISICPRRNWQDQDIAYRDERTWSVPSYYTLGHATSQGNGVLVSTSGRQRTRCSSGR
jgi:hypothetical protein